MIRDTLAVTTEDNIREKNLKHAILVKMNYKKKMKKLPSSLKTENGTMETNKKQKVYVYCIG